MCSCFLHKILKDSLEGLMVNLTLLVDFVCGVAILVMLGCAISCSKGMVAALYQPVQSLWLCYWKWVGSSCLMEVVDCHCQICIQVGKITKFFGKFLVGRWIACHFLTSLLCLCLIRAERGNLHYIGAKVSQENSNQEVSSCISIEKQDNAHN